MEGNGESEVVKLECEDSGWEDAKSTGTDSYFIIRVLLPSRRVREITGPCGANIKRLRRDYNVIIDIPEGMGPERIMSINTYYLFTGCEVLGEALKAMEPEAAEIHLLVHQSQACALIGRDGNQLKQLQETTGSVLKVFTECCPMSTDRVVEIKADITKITNTVYNIIDFLNAIPAVGLIKNYDALHFDESTASEYGGYTYLNQSGPRGSGDLDQEIRGSICEVSLCSTSTGDASLGSRGAKSPEDSGSSGCGTSLGSSLRGDENPSRTFGGRRGGRRSRGGGRGSGTPVGFRFEDSSSSEGDNSSSEQQLELSPPVLEFSGTPSKVVVRRGRGRGRAASRGKSRCSGSAAGRRGSLTHGDLKRAIDDLSVSYGAATPPKVSRLPAAEVVNCTSKFTVNCVPKFTYGVNAYRHWVLQHNAQLEKANADPSKKTTGSRSERPLEPHPLDCTERELNSALCMFVREVRKPNGSASGEPYAPDSILYLCLSIQEYLSQNGRDDNIFADVAYEGFTDRLNEILSRSVFEVLQNLRGFPQCHIEEDYLWESKHLGSHTPHVLLNTLVYFNTKYFMLRTPAQHLALSFSETHVMKYMTKRKTSYPAADEVPCFSLQYYSRSTDPTSGKENMRMVEQKENLENPARCPVALYELYRSKCPGSMKNRNDVFYLIPDRSRESADPVWYSTNAVDLETMTKMVNRLRLVREIQEVQME